MARYRVPDHLICLGGGGTAVGETYMQQDWILEEVVQDDPRDKAPDEDQTDLHAFFIDTDKSTLRDMSDEVKNSVDKLQQKLDVIKTPDIKASDINIAFGPHQQYLEPTEVVSPATIEGLMSEQGLDAWWLEKDDDILGPLEGLARGGVKRKRGLTKAIYRIVQWKSNVLSDIEQSISSHNSEDPNAAVVVGLGGGTGSGLLIDLARQINKAGATVTLFGVLPAPSGNDDKTELANAYAALSELEYLALSGENYFKNIVLLPYEPKRDKEIFDKAATYTINAYYNLSKNQTNTFKNFNEDETDGPPRYAPFTIASTRYLHYLREDIKKTRRSFDNYIETKRKLISAENLLYDELEDYISSNYEDAADELYTTDGLSNIRLENDVALNLIERADDIRELLNQEFMKEFEFQSAEEILDRFDEIKVTAEEAAEWDEESDKAAAIARELVEDLADNINNVEDYEPQDGWASDEQKFVSTIIDEFQLIARRGGIIKARNAIQSDTDVSKAITTDISNAIKEKHSGVDVKISDHIDRIKGEISELEEDIEALNTLISAGEEQTSELKKGWENKVTNSVEEYYTLMATKEDITNLLNELKEEIDEQIDLQLAREAENIRINGTDFEEYGELNTLLDNAGCEKVDRESIEDAVRYVKKARKVQLTARDRQASLKEKVRVALPLMSGTIGGLRSDYRTLQNDIADSQVIDLPNWDEEFDPSVRSEYFVSRSSNLDDQMERSLDTIENHTKQILDTATDKRTDPDEFLSDGSHNRATQMLNHYNFDDKDTDGSVTTEGIASIATNVSSAQQLGQRIKDGSLEEALSDILVAPFEQRKDNKEAVLAEKRNTLDSYEVLKSIVKNEGQTYAERADNVPDSDEIANFPDVGTPGPFKMDVKPRDRGRLGGTETLADTNLWDREAEQAHLLEHLNTIMPELTGEHLPINKIGISHEDTAQPRYDGYRAASVFMSPMFEKYQEEGVAQIEDVTHSINDDVNIKESEYFAARGTFADAYDFAMTTFLTGVFLDNLQVFTDDCRDAYTRVTDVPPEDSDRHNHRDSVPKTVQHHTYALDGMTYHTEGQFLPQQSDGGFCYREKLLNLDGEDVKVLLDQAGEPKMNTEQVVERLLEDYYEIVGYESTV